MMNVVMVHPIHGAKIATHEQEIREDILNGWSRQTDADAFAALDAPVENGTLAVKHRGKKVPSFLQPTQDGLVKE